MDFFLFAAPSVVPLPRRKESFRLPEVCTVSPFAPFCFSQS